jgi:hypothetical protein
VSTSSVLADRNRTGQARLVEQPRKREGEGVQRDGGEHARLITRPVRCGFEHSCNQEMFTTPRKLPAAPIPKASAAAAERLRTRAIAPTIRASAFVRASSPARLSQTPPDDSSGGVFWCSR